MGKWKDGSMREGVQETKEKALEVAKATLQSTLVIHGGERHDLSAEDDVFLFDKF